MEPGNPPQQWNAPRDASFPSGESRGSGSQEPTSGAPPGGYGPPSGASGSNRNPAKRGRPGLIVLAAFVVELVLIAAFGNQFVVKHIANFGAHHRDKFIGQLADAATVYSWRFNSVPGDTHHLALAELGLVLTVFVVTVLLALALVRGPVTFARAFFGTWLAVIIATLVGAIVEHLITRVQNVPGFSRFAEALFFGPNGFAFTAGVCLGFVVALIASVVAIATRRPAAAATDPSLAPGGPSGHEPSSGTASEPGQDVYSGDQPPRHAAESEHPSREDLATTQLPAVQDERRAEGVRGPAAPPGSEQHGDGGQATSAPGVARDDPTTQLPRFPGANDEEGRPPEQK